MENYFPRQAKFEGGACHILTFGNVWTIVTSPEGQFLISEQSGIRPTACLEISDRWYLLAFSNDSIWILDANVRAVCELNHLASSDPRARDAVTKFADHLVFLLRNRLILDESLDFRSILRPFGEGALLSLARFCGQHSKSYPVLKLSSQFEIVTGPFTQDKLSISRSSLERVLATAMPSILLTARSGHIPIPSLIGEGRVDAAYFIDFNANSSFYCCLEKEGILKFYVYFENGAAQFLFFPFNDVIISKNQILDINNLLFRLDSELIKLNLSSTKKVQSKADKLGIMSAGPVHFAHAIWDELQGLDLFLTEAPQDRPAPYLYFSPSYSGIDMFGPVEELYPEFRGKVSRITTDFRIHLAQAIEKGIEIVPPSGRMARSRTRERIQAVVARNAARSGLEHKSKRAIMDRNKKRLVVTLGLRLTNRCPVDNLGLYYRIAKKISEHFGPTTIIIDGLVGEPHNDNKQYMIFNSGSDNQSSNPKLAVSEQDKELNWVREFTDLIRSSSITVINCVGMSILDNLFWLSQSDFFVAPFGNGLTKLRWALDIPGLVLTSQINLDYLYGRHAYDDEKWMEKPFTPLYFTEPFEVEDIPPETARENVVTEWGIPYPDSFVVNEDLLIPRLLDMLAKRLLI